MTSIDKFLYELSELEIQVWLDDGKLRCKAPQGVVTQEIQEQLYSRKHDIIEYLENLNQETTDNDVIPPAPREPLMPLSFAQERLYFLEKLGFKGTPYNEIHAIKITGELQSATLKQSLEQLIFRHEILRTVFQEKDGQPGQEILSEIEVPFFEYNLTGISHEDKLFEADRLFHESEQRPFNLEQVPLFRLLLINLNPDEYLLALVIHHIIYDAWSVKIFWDELLIIYQACLKGENPDLPEAKLHYADYAVWQRHWLENWVLKKQLRFWKTNFSDDLPMLELPTDQPRRSVPTFNGALHHFYIEANLLAQLKAVSRQFGCTLNITLYAVFSTLLHRYSGLDEIVTGFVVANRYRLELEQLIGFFVNTLPFRVTFEKDVSFESILKQTKKMAFSAYENQDVPFDRLVSEIQPQRDLNRNPFFQVLFVFQNTPKHDVQLKDLQIEDYEIDNTQSKFDMTLHAFEKNDHIKCTFEYNTDLFNNDTIQRMGEHFLVLLKDILQNPAKPVSEYSILTEKEKHQILTEWNSQNITFPVEQAIHQIFENQVTKSPEAVAIEFEDQSLTYSELNRRANRVARYLIHKGVTPDSIVGLCLERSLEMVIGILAILKAGGAYLPLDPLYPAERLSLMLQDSKARFVLTRRQHKKMFSDTDCSVIPLDNLWESITPFPDENPQTSVEPEHLAYIIYTSGSTGKPKGVMISHQNVVRLFKCTDASFQFNSQDVWTLFHSFAFDFSVWEIWGALLYGGRLIVVPYWISRNPEAFQKLLFDKKVTVLNQTPSAFKELIKVETQSVPEKRLNLRYVVFGGEALDIASLTPWFDKYGDESPKLINMYGITETTVHVTYREIRRSDATAGKSYIGCPIPDLQVYIVDKNLNLLPISVPGEMLVGGAGLARGYLNDPDLTEKRFVKNHLIQQSGSRLYRSGDLARFLPNGEIEYLGRIDHQVKIRGFRIELGEIQHHLHQHPSVQECCVILADGPGSEKQINAYVVNRNGKPPSISQLRQFLENKLPDYMIPAAFVFIEKIPITINGKIDRKQLPRPENVRPELDTSFQVAQNEIESQITKVWQDVLKIDKVGIYDNFFDLGGHSLLMIQVQDRLRKICLNDLMIVHLFKYPTIYSLAQFIQEKTAIQTDTGYSDRAHKIAATAARKRKSFQAQKQRIAKLRNVNDSK